MPRKSIRCSCAAADRAGVPLPRGRRDRAARTPPCRSSLTATGWLRHVPARTRRRWCPSPILHRHVRQSRAPSTSSDSTRIGASSPTDSSSTDTLIAMLCAAVHSITTMRTCSAADSGTRSPLMMNCGAMDLERVCALRRRVAQRDDVDVDLCRVAAAACRREAPAAPSATARSWHSAGSSNASSSTGSKKTCVHQPHRQVLQLAFSQRSGQRARARRR
jgi:hypothetical protein